MANSGSEYEVFLNFCGMDTRRGFTNTLYHALIDAGIHVFIDNEEIPRGEEFSTELLQAIDDSKLYITIFSPNYASKHWCLRELAKMVENAFGPEEDGNKKVESTSKSEEDGNKKAIFPIFYNVKTDDLKSNKGLYNKAIAELEQKMVNQKRKVSTEEVEKWRRALQKVGGIQGWELEKYDGDGHLSETIVEEGLRKLQTRHREVTIDLVGMENRIADINNLLDVESGDVRLIGIWGMGGMGKTTLAENIFNELCPHFGRNCSFLADVRGRMAQTNGLFELQQELLSDISYSRGACNIGDTNQGIKAIQRTLCSKKVLIVLDDVGDSNHIRNLIGEKLLYSGSRIIVTARYKNVLVTNKFEFKEYEMVGLSNDDALKLFRRHAFKVDSPPLDYLTLSGDIVSTTGGLPLALRAIGSSLFSQEDIEIWEEMLKELRKIPHDNVLEMLEITYNALKPGQQQIFLDIACFFIGSDETNPIYMWKDCEFSPKTAIRVLINRSMIKVLDNNRFWMHDQFRDLGRAISNRERSRFWARDDIIRELRIAEFSTSVQAIDYNSGSWIEEDHKHLPLTSEQIKRLSHLRLLQLRNITCHGDFRGCLSDLKWINLDYKDQSCFTATNFNPENVVVMAISGEAWREHAVISLVEGARKLKALTLARIPSLHRTPTFSEDSVLEKLTFDNCGYLKEIDCSIWKLRWLTDLSLEYGVALRKLPEQIGELKNLQHLSLMSCRSLTELPDSVSDLKSLAKLNLSHTSITRLPDSIGGLQSLSSLDLSQTSIAKLPETMGKLSQLHTLDLHNSDIQELPKLPGSLTTLRLRSRSLQTVPDLSILTNLVELLLSDASDMNGKSNIIQPCDLPWIGKLSKLRKLELCLLNVNATSTDWASLTLLRKLTLEGLDLQMLKRLPSNLRVLELDNTRVKQVELDGLPQLEELAISGSELITRITIPSSLRKLRVARVYSCNKLVEVQFLGVLESIETLCIGECESFKRLVYLSEGEPGCNEAQAPELTDGWGRVSLVSSSLKMLQHLNLTCCPELQEIQFVSTFESLEGIVVRECILLKRLGGLSNLKNLRRLKIANCESLQVVDGVDELERLEQLEVYSCRSMEKIIDASSSKIPNECQVQTRDCGELLDTGPYASEITWKCYREKILNAPTQALDLEMETTSSDWETETGDPLSEQAHALGTFELPSHQQDDGDEDDHDEADGMEDEDDKDNNGHEVLQSSRGPPPISSVGDNDGNNDVTEEGRGKGDGEDDEDMIRTRKIGTMKKLKRSGFCSCLEGLRMFIPWIMTGNDEKEEESNDDEAEEELRDGIE
ncbi:disease resistance protein RUN1-like [Rhodamnia argentea]|uniref:Disease resistance protein RUN1-like n=1 Tax=Rhodamnia argentea TaxID=178133 RepID=A0ABM3HCW0_9MYRT|nr:disease resistance protein RUN1-like [Rhodamnia argentea]